MRAFTAARDARHARRDLAVRAPAGLHAGPRRQGRARARRRRHPGGADRPRRPGHVPRARARWSPIRWSTCAGSASTSRNTSSGSSRRCCSTLEPLRRHRPSRARRAGHLRAAGRPVRPCRAAPAGPRADPFAGPRQDRRARRQGEPPLHLSRRRAERRDGPATLRRASTRAVMPG